MVRKTGPPISLRLPVPIASSPPTSEDDSVTEFGPDVTLDAPAFIHPTALVYGKVTIGEGASLWPYAVIRAEMEEVRIGRFSNVQDHAMIHIGNGFGTFIGDWCSITHGTTIHGATIGDCTLIGINATVMDGCVVGRNCVIAGHTILKEGTHIPDNSIVMGVPGKVVRSVNNYRQTKRNALLYHRNALAYAAGDHRVWASAAFAAELREANAIIDREFEEMSGP